MGRQAPSSVVLACDPGPFGTRPFGEVIPFRTDHVPVHHGPLRAGGRSSRSDSGV